MARAVGAVVTAGARAAKILWVLCTAVTLKKKNCDFRSAGYYIFFASSRSKRGGDGEPDGPHFSEAETVIKKRAKRGQKPHFGRDIQTRFEVVRLLHSPKVKRQKGTSW
jgi:hypothetical protein